MKPNLRMLSTGLFLTVSAAAQAGDVVGLTPFTSGTPALASEVNGNFTAVKSAVDDNHSRLTTVEGANAAGRLTALEGLDAASRLTALEARFAVQVTCPANAPNRFTDNGDGTICDRDTGLMWEKKLANSDPNCGDPIPANRDIHCVTNKYLWIEAIAGNITSDRAWLDFLAKMNGGLSVSSDGATSTPTSTGYAGYRDWRVPSVDEMQSILPNRCNAQTVLCTDSAFGPWFNITNLTSSSDAADPTQAWFVQLDTPTKFTKASGSGLARAVRNGR